MKYGKYLAIALGLVLCLLFAGWYLRNTIIERISNPIMARYGLTLTDVSLDALASRDATIGHLEFEHRSGAQIAVRNLTLPIRVSLQGYKTYSATQVTIDLPQGGDGDPPGAAFALQQLLALPQLLPQVRILLESIVVPPYPEIRNARWLLEGDAQELAMEVGALSLVANISRVSDTRHVLLIALADSAGNSPAQTASIEIERTGTGFSLTGRSRLELPFWMALARAFGVDAVDELSGSVEVRFDTELPDDSQAEIQLFADLSPLTPVRITTPDVAAAATLLEAAPFEVSVAFPGGAWTLRQPSASLHLSYAGLPDLQATLTNQVCRSATVCSGDIRMVMENAVLPFAKVGQVTLQATQELTLDGNTVDLRLLPNASLSMTGIANEDISLQQLDVSLGSGASVNSGVDGWKFFTGSVELRLTGFAADDISLQQLDVSAKSGASVNSGADAWRFFADSVDLRLSGLSALEDLSLTAPVFLDKVEFAGSDQALSAKFGIYAAATEIQWGERLISLPAFSGGISRQDAEVAVILNTDGLQEEARLEIGHNLLRDAGRLTISEAAVSFDTRAMSTWLKPWPNPWDIAAGTLAIDLQSDWQRRAGAWQVTAASTLRLSRLAGNYKDTAFVGLSSDIVGRYATERGFTIEPAGLAIELVEVGMPVENIAATFELIPEDESVNVQDLRMQIFGGVVTALPFSFGTARESNTIILQAESIDLGRIMSMQEFESVEVSGKIGANIPVTIENDIITINGGTLEGETPGGTIRYLPGIAAGSADTSALGFASRALSNFNYDSLTAGLDYTSAGDLKLQMRLSGRNPDLEGNRPVVLNLGVENNVPQMLRSLRAARAVEEILERRMAQ